MDRYQAEIAALARRAADPTLPVLDRTEAVLILHFRTEARGCLCGWFRLGASFPRHQAEALAELGLLKGAP